jgi:hypothetical protein
MISRQEAARLKKQFWTTLGKYLAPIPGAEGLSVNWLNYKTGVRHLFFRMDANNEQASISIEFNHPDVQHRHKLFAKFILVKNIFQQAAGSDWTWEEEGRDDDGKPISRIITRLSGVHINQQSDWPAIISFLKTKMVGLDAFWASVKELMGPES